MVDKARLGAGDVEFELDGKQVALRPSLQACQAISRMHGGLLEALRKVGNGDMDTIVSVVGFGLGLKPGDDFDAVAEQVWRTGPTKVAVPAIKFIGNISNGGRPRTEGGGGKPAADPTQADS